jgi:hypothetical protein
MSEGHVVPGERVGARSPTYVRGLVSPMDMPRRKKRRAAPPRVGPKGCSGTAAVHRRRAGGRPDGGR